MFIQNDFSYNTFEPDNFYFFYDWRFHSNEKDKTIRNCFSLFYADGVFLEAIYRILKEYSDIGVEGCWWYYPDLESPYPNDVFESVCFELGFDDPPNRVYVTECQNFQYTKHACDRFLEMHPEHKQFIEELLSNCIPLN